jgi:hypothetical protein
VGRGQKKQDLEAVNSFFIFLWWNCGMNSGLTLARQAFLLLEQLYQHHSEFLLSNKIFVALVLGSVL